MVGSSGNSITEIAARLAFACKLESWSESTNAVQCKSGETWKRLLDCTEFPTEIGGNLASFETHRPRALRTLRFMKHESCPNGTTDYPLLDYGSHPPAREVDQRLEDSGWVVQQCPRTSDFLGVSGFWGGLMASKKLAEWRFESGAQVVKSLHDWN